MRVSFKCEPETIADLKKGLVAIWEKYRAALETDFRSGKGPLD